MKIRLFAVLIATLVSTGSALAQGSYDRNVGNCRAGLSFVCNETLLTPEQQAIVKRAALDRNFSNCRSGLAFACNQSLLTPAQQNLLAAPAELQQDVIAQSPAASTPVEPSVRGVPPSGLGYPCAENGSCYGDISTLTGRPKTVRVQGYYRKDGTYVRGHYRSRPRR